MPALAEKIIVDIENEEPEDSFLGLRDTSTDRLLCFSLSRPRRKPLLVPAQTKEIGLPPVDRDADHNLRTFLSGGQYE